MVVPAYNARRTLDEQLDALERQDYPGEFEVIVSDNGSNDGLREHLRSRRGPGPIRMEYIDSSQVRGAAHARNEAIFRSRGDFIAFCDADDRVHDDWLSELVALAPSFDAVAGSVETLTLNSSEVCKWLPMPDPEQIPMVFGWKRAIFSGSFGMWRRTAEAVEGFDATYHRGGEDNDLALRIQLAGLTIGHASKAVVSVRLRSSYRDLWKQMYRYGQADAMLYAAYRDQGVPVRRPRATLKDLARIVILNPIVPQHFTNYPRGLWVKDLANIAGKARGSLRQRTYYV